MPSLFPDLFIYGFFVPTVLRLTLGAAFISLGFFKLKNTRQTAKYFGNIGIKPAKFSAITAGVLEFTAGLFLVIGFLVQLASLIIAVIMLLSLFIVWKKGKSALPHGYRFYFLYFIIAVSLLFLGPGAFAIDLPL